MHCRTCSAPPLPNTGRQLLQIQSRWYERCCAWLGCDEQQCHYSCVKRTTGSCYQSSRTVRHSPLGCCRISHGGPEVAELIDVGVGAGLRFGTEESIARNSKRANWLKLPHLTGKIAVCAPQRKRLRPQLAESVWAGRECCGVMLRHVWSRACCCGRFSRKCGRFFGHTRLSTNYRAWNVAPTLSFGTDKLVLHVPEYSYFVQP